MMDAQARLRAKGLQPFHIARTKKEPGDLVLSLNKVWRAPTAPERPSHDN